jgi:hypothetical protein
VLRRGDFPSTRPEAAPAFTMWPQIGGRFTARAPARWHNECTGAQERLPHTSYVELKYWQALVLSLVYQGGVIHIVGCRHSTGKASLPRGSGNREEAGPLCEDPDLLQPAASSSELKRCDDAEDRFATRANCSRSVC